MRPQVVRGEPGAEPQTSREQVLAAAADLFGAKGYEATSMREIGAAAGMTAPALYHYFPSKDEIFCATHEAGMNLIQSAVEQACARCTDPWQRLEAAAVAHCETLLRNDRYRSIISPNFPNVSPAICRRLTAQRDRYERFVKRLVTSLDLPPDIDPVIFRMQFLGAINWTTTWFRPAGRLTPAMIARQVVRQMRDGVGGGT